MLRQRAHLPANVGHLAGLQKGLASIFERLCAPHEAKALHPGAGHHLRSHLHASCTKLSKAVSLLYCMRTTSDLYDRTCYDEEHECRLGKYQKARYSLGGTARTALHA